MLESDWLTNILRCAIIFRETHGEGTALHVHITSPNDLRYFKGPYSLKQQKNQNPQRHWPNKYILNIQSTDYIHVFATKLRFIMYGKHILSLSRSLSLTDSLHTR